MTQEFRDALLNEILSLPIREGFEMPKGLPIPSKDFVLLHQEGEKEQVTEGAKLILPTSDKNPYSRRATIYGIGIDVKMPLKLGMQVTAAWHSLKSQENVVTHLGNVYHYVSEHDIHCYVTDNNYVNPHIANKDEKRREDRADNIIKTDQRDWVEHQKNTEQ